MRIRWCSESHPIQLEVMKRQITILALAAALATPALFGASNAELKAITKTISSVPLAGLPAKAAALVKQASREDREQVAVAAGRAAIYKSRSSAPSIVAAV